MQNAAVGTSALVEGKDDKQGSLVTNLKSLIEQVQASIALVETAIAREFGAELRDGNQEAAADIFVLDDVTPPYEQAHAALKASDAQLGAALQFIPDAKRSEMPDIKAAAVASRADQARGDLQLVEGLVPDIVEPVGLGHARADAGIDEVEKEQSGQAFRRGSRHWLQHRRAANIMTDNTGLLQAERIHQRQHVGCVLIGAERTARLVAVAEAAQIRREQRESIPEPRHHRLLGQGKFRPAVQQQ
jgi:hypothetical protein